jgi:tetratricopeptide (TPR) repeat protein
LHGCAGIYNVVEFEVLEPASVTLPAEISQIIVLNRAPITLHAFEQKDVEGLEKKHLMILDTLIVKSIQRGLLDVFRESPVERFHHPIWLDERREDTTKLEDMVLTRREVDEICSDNGGDAILSLESYFMDYQEHVQSFSDSYFTATKYYQISNIIQWNIYLRGSPKPFDSYTMVDTLYFTEIQDGEVIRRFSTSQMLTESFYKSGMRYGRYLVPLWTRTTRNLYKGKEEELRHASKLTSQGNWDQAFEIWEALSESDETASAAKALYNMAVFYELEDQLDSASLLVDKALKLDTLDMIRSYKEEIDMRILNRSELFKEVR